MVCTGHKTVLALCILVAQRHMKVPYVESLTYVNYILDMVGTREFFVIGGRLVWPTHGTTRMRTHDICKFPTWRT